MNVFELVRVMGWSEERSQAPVVGRPRLAETPPHPRHIRLYVTLPFFIPSAKSHSPLLESPPHDWESSHNPNSEPGPRLG